MIHKENFQYYFRKVTENLFKLTIKHQSEEANAVVM